jgi:hypothetical protein
MTGHWRSRLTRLLSALTRPAARTELDDEFESHLNLAGAEYQRQGHSSAEARRHAAVRRPADRPRSSAVDAAGG